MHPSEWHPQDWICVIEALCWFASDDLVENRDAAYAQLLIDEIAVAQGLEASELLLQTDRDRRECRSTNSK